MSATDHATASATHVRIEHVLWTPGNEWRAAVEHVAERFRRVRPLDASAVLAIDGLSAQLDALDAWVGDGDIDLDRELGRYLDEHLSMHVRPDAARTRAVRALAAAGPVHAVSALPPRAAESIARHAGAWRSFAELHAGARGADDADVVVTPEQLLARAAAAARI